VKYRIEYWDGRRPKNATVEAESPEDAVRQEVGADVQLKLSWSGGRWDILVLLLGDNILPIYFRLEDLLFETK
jgi:hypothetical protein